MYETFTEKQNQDLEINKLRGGGFQWRISAHLIEPDEYSVVIQIRSKVDSYNKGKLFKQVIEALSRLAYELYEQYTDGDQPETVYPIMTCKACGYIFAKRERCPACQEEMTDNEPTTTKARPDPGQPVEITW